jgi:hypothetical protein
VALLAAAIVSDRLDSAFWAHNPLLTNLVSSLVVVALSVAVFNETLERRRRRGWSVLAQYVLFELVGTARLVWTTLMEILGLMYAGEETVGRAIPASTRNRGNRFLTIAVSAPVA